MDAKTIFECNELTHKKENNEIMHDVINEFFWVSRFTFFEELCKKNFENYYDAFYYLKHLIYTKAPKLIPTLNAVLDSYGYNDKCEVIDAVRLLSNQDALRDIKNMSDYVLKSPNIYDFNYNLGRMTLNTKQGKYNFMNIRKYFKDNDDALRYLVKYDLNNLCHQASWDMLSYADRCDLITSLIPVYFTGWAYHTYLEELESGLILDSSNGFVMEKKEYESLFRPTEIVRTRDIECEKEYNKIIKTRRVSDDFSQPMVIALNKQRG